MMVLPMITLMKTNLSSSKLDMLPRQLTSGQNKVTQITLSLMASLLTNYKKLKLLTLMIYQPLLGLATLEKILLPSN
jgi:hypothetical protein